MRPWRMEQRKMFHRREDAGQLIGSAPGMYYEKVYSKQLVNVLFSVSFRWL